MDEARIEKQIREDLRKIREAAGLSQTEIGELFGWERAAVSKLETGHIKIKMSDFLTIANSCRDAIPGHPAVALYDYYMPRKARKSAPYAPPPEE